VIAVIVGVAHAVSVVLGGVLVPASRPAWVDSRGFVFAPVDPIVRRIAQLVRVDRTRDEVVVQRDGRSVVMRFGPEAVVEPDGTIYLRLGPVVRGLGGRLSFDAVRKVVAIEMPAPGPVTTPTPFQPTNPTVAPTTVFTPQPIVTPRPSPSGIPQPRRTPVPVVPSFPSTP
jgi:hypothetical protein